MFQGDINVLQEIANIPFLSPSTLLHDINTTPFSEGDRVLVYLTGHSVNTFFFYGPQSKDVWRPDDLCHSLANGGDAGTSFSTLSFFSFPNKSTIQTIYLH